jgi:putative ABC transport system permease protein
VKINGENTGEIMSSLEKTYLSFDDKFGFEAYFLDQKNQDLYLAERQALQVFTLFASIALFLAALGLLGLAYLIIIQRTKEIGIRKILGATVSNILWKENLSFLKLLAVALAMGLPVAFLTMKEWLAGFAYQVPVGVYPFGVTMAVIVVIACLSVTLAILRTVLANPSEALRYE